MLIVYRLCDHYVSSIRWSRKITTNDYLSIVCWSYSAPVMTIWWPYDFIVSHTILNQNMLKISAYVKIQYKYSKLRSMQILLNISGKKLYVILYNCFHPCFRPPGVPDPSFQHAVHAADLRHQAGNLLCHSPLLLDHLCWRTYDGTLYSISIIQRLNYREYDMC